MGAPPRPTPLPPQPLLTCGALESHPVWTAWSFHSLLSRMAVRRSKYGKYVCRSVVFM